MVRTFSEKQKEGLRFTGQAVTAMQEATEAYTVNIMASANLCALHARRVTLMPRDVTLALRLNGDRN